MGTRGLVFIRCNGRYYVYYNHFDSYPEGLGRAIVQEIPTDSEEYRLWLENIRGTYSRLCQQFENDILCVSPKFGQPGGMSSRSERYARSYLTVDDRLEMPPTQTLLSAGDGDIFTEWTYTIDLDRELFTVDKAVSFNLSRLPHHPNWYEFLTEDRRGRRALLKNTPSDLIGHVVNKIEVDGSSKERYSSFHMETKLPEVLNSFISANASRETLLIETMSAICSNYRALIDRSYLEWTSTSFSFREIAFAILSIAAGELAFKSPKELNRSYSDEGFFLIPDNEQPDSEQTLLPKFLSECHSPGANPGSAPQANPFWLGNVLVYLTPRIDLPEVEEAAIVTVVDSGLGQGLTSFHALVFSIMDFILIRATKSENGDVQLVRTPLTNLLYFDDKLSWYFNGPRSRPSVNSTGCNKPKEDDEPKKNRDSGDPSGSNGDADDADDGDSDSESGNVNAVITCKMLIQFFDATTDQYLAGTRSRVFPNEILTTIMALSDHQTYLSLARTSACCRDYYYRTFRLNDDYAILKADCGLPSNSFTLEDLDSGLKVPSSLCFNNKSKTNIKLSPIVGVTEPSRMSILDEWSLTFQDVTPKRAPHTGKKDMPRQEQFSYLSHPNGPEPERLFELADYLYLGSLEDAFGRYILGIIHGQDIYKFTRIDGAHYRSVIPHGYRILKMDQFYCSGMHIFLRSRCDESAEEWAKTVEYAVQQLHDKENKKESRFDLDARGSPVIVAFHRRVKLFYYVNKRVDPPPPVTASLPQCAEIAERCMESDPTRRLVNLIPGDEPISLDDRESREKFEGWVCSFYSADQNMEEWDPFTAEMITLRRS